MLGIWDYIENKVEVGAAPGGAISPVAPGAPLLSLQGHFLNVRLAEEAKLCVSPGV